MPVSIEISNLFDACSFGLYHAVPRVGAWIISRSPWLLGHPADLGLEHSQPKGVAGATAGCGAHGWERLLEATQSVFPGWGGVG